MTAAVPTPTAEHRPARIPSLDGVRTIAVLAVLLFHAGIPFFKGGWIGVDLFIVLSGYLITGGLLEVVVLHQHPSYTDFLVRRFRRLAPAALVVVIAVILLSFAKQLSLTVRAVAAAATWTSNWFQIASSAGYWSRLAGPQPLDHLWSLAVEEQFYIAWPLVLLGVCWLTGRLTAHRRVAVIRWSAFLGALLSIALGAFGSQRGWSLDRLYLGTDTRSAGFLLGAAVGGIRLRKHSIAYRLTRIGGPIALVVVLAATTTLTASTSMFRGALPVLDTACVVLVLWATTTQKGLLAARPVAAFGRITYSAYLWHWPILLLLQRSVTQPWLRFALALPLTTCAAFLSFTFVESRFRRPHQREPRTAHTGAVRRSAGVAVAISLCVITALINTPTLDASPIQVTFTPTQIALAATTTTTAVAATTTSPTTPTSGVGNHQASRPACQTIIHLGDSNLGVAAPLFKAAYSAMHVRWFVDHANGRSAFRSHDSTLDGTVAEIEKYRRSAPSPRCWIIHASLADAAEARRRNVEPVTAITAILHALNGEPTLWLTPSLQGPFPDDPPAAAAYSSQLTRLVADAHNVVLIDWRSIADPRASEFQPDGIHYRSDLYLTLVTTVVNAIHQAWVLVPSTVR